MNFCRGPKRAHRMTAGLCLLVLCMLFLFSLCWFNHRIRPLAMQAARARAILTASDTVNGVVEALLDERPLKAVSVAYHEGEVMAVETDVTAVNRFRSASVRAVSEHLKLSDEMRFAIPIGNLIGGELMAGRGMPLTVSLLPLGDVSAEVHSEFKESGINQTLHRILIRFHITLAVIIGSDSTQIDCTEEICVAETVIIGKVPDAYTAINRFEIDEQEENDLNDYAATIP